MTDLSVVRDTFTNALIAAGIAGEPVLQERYLPCTPFGYVPAVVIREEQGIVAIYQRNGSFFVDLQADFGGDNAVDYEGLISEETGPYSLLDEAIPSAVEFITLLRLAQAGVLPWERISSYLPELV